MRGITEDRRAFEDERGHRYPFRELAVKLTDTIVRTIGLVVILFAIGLIWEAVH